MSALQTKTIAAMLEGGTLAEVAERAGTSERTIRRWMQNPEFKAALTAAKQELVQDAVMKLQRATSKAASALIRNVDCGSATAEISAARTILHLGVEAVTVAQLEDRIAELESALEALTPPRKRKHAIT